MAIEQFSIIPQECEIHKFRNCLLDWFVDNQRHYPWRETDDPFRLLLAEMMLRRTNANQVEKVYVELFDKFPDSYSISKADEKKIEEILIPLGLKWRIPSIISVTKIIQKEYNGKIPYTRKELTNLPGVGDYVAGAVLSIAFNKREWIVDSNVVRVFKRYFGITTSKEGRRDKHVIEIAKIYSSCDSPRDANLAILDFAAKVCTSGNSPHCFSCPLKDFCNHYSQQN